MLTLALLRHAKSSWDTAALDDFARPLADRGRKAAPLMGSVLATEMRPDLILCSAAVRTRATLDLVLPYLGVPPPAVAFEEGLYLASASDLITRLRSVPPRWQNILMVGHNPGFHDLALTLAASVAPEQIATLVTKFPTAALAIFALDCDHWSGIGPRTGRLTRFITPASLEIARASAERTR